MHKKKEKTTIKKQKPEDARVTKKYLGRSSKKNRDIRVQEIEILLKDKIMRNLVRPMTKRKMREVIIKAVQIKFTISKFVDNVGKLLLLYICRQIGL